MNVYEEVREFYESYRKEKQIIGQSVLGRNLYALHVGSFSGPQGISQYGIHAREWITGPIGLSHVRRGLFCGGVWILPLMNPDGALLSETGLESVPRELRGELIRINGGEDFSLWKANAAAVDLNVNFDARWGTGARNLRERASENYIGPCPFSEPETQALRDFTLRVGPQFTVSWHTKGEEIYWDFHQPFFKKLRDKRLAAVLSRSTGYPLCRARHSAGGYKDWCVETLKIPAFTVEAGEEVLSHPIARQALPALLNKTLDALVDLTNALLPSR